MRPVDTRTIRWAALTIISFGVVVLAVQQANRNTDAAVIAVDAFVDCTLYADDGDTCEREGKEVLATRGRP
jgi:hypothetical protein